MGKYRTAFYRLLPDWLTSDDGERVLFALTRVIDGVRTSWRESLMARFPTYAGTSALAKIGQDRGIFRGRTEPVDNYRARLRAWRYPRGHRTRGSAFALLEQIWAYWGGIRCVTIDNNGTAFTVAVDGAKAVSYGNTWDWDGAGAAPWARFWPILYLDTLPATPWPQLLGAWGNSLQPGRGYTLGQQGVTPADTAAMRRLFRPPSWKPAGTWTYYAVVALETVAINPDGTWDTFTGRSGAPSVLRFWALGRSP